jgi:hypothetical protein
MSAKRKIIIGCVFAVLALDFYYIFSPVDIFPASMNRVKTVNYRPKDPICISISSMPWKKICASMLAQWTPSEIISGNTQDSISYRTEPFEGHIEPLNAPGLS